MIKAFVVNVRRLEAVGTVLDGWKLFFAIMMSTHLPTVGYSLTVCPSTGDAKSTIVVTTQGECKHGTLTGPPGTMIGTHVIEVR